MLPGWASGAGAHPSPPDLGQIGLFFAKVGLFTFGGGLVLLAFLQDQGAVVATGPHFVTRAGAGKAIDLSRRSIR